MRAVKIAIVTGASSGLGREFVRQIDEQEALDEIWAVARRRDRLEELAERTRTRVRILSLDLREKESFETLSRLLAEIRPEVRMLVNAAGFGRIGSCRDASLADCDGMIDLNCRASVDMTQIALPYLSRGSRVLQICSTSAFQPFPYLNVYAASKAFLYRYSRALRVELLGEGIRVTAVCPYWVRDTEFIRKARRTKNSAYIRSFPLASRAVPVVQRALRDSALGLAVSTPGVVCAVHRVAAKILPGEVMMGVWALLRRL